MKRYGFVIAFLSILFSSCHFGGGPVVRGDGNITTEQRKYENFTAIEVSNAIVLEVTQDSAYSVKVETDSNIQELVEVYMEGKLLHINLAPRMNYDPTGDIKVYVSAPAFDHIGANGACQINGKNLLTAKSHFSLDLRGACGANLEVDAPEVLVDVSGASGATLKGKTRDLRVEGSGASRIRAFDLLAENVSINLTGACDGDVYASVRLDGQLSGASNIDYKGNAQSNVSTSGASSVRKSN